MKPPERNLKRLFFAPLIWMAATVFLVEEAIWDFTAGIMAQLGKLSLIYTIEQRIAALRPRWAFFAFMLPSLILVPAKLFGLHAIATGHWFLGTLIFVIAKILGLALFSRIFNLTRPALMQLFWFARFYQWVMRYRNRIHDFLANWKTYQQIKQRLISGANALKAKWMSSLESIKK